MARRYCLVALVAVASLIAIGFHDKGFAENQNAPDTHSSAADTEEHAASIGRYQVAAFGKDGNHGYYILDTATGELWSNYRDGKPSRISGPLTE